MNEWNATATVREHSFKDGIRLLKNFGPVCKTDYFNVLVIRVDTIPALLSELSAQIKNKPDILNILARVIPASCTFDLMCPEECEKNGPGSSLNIGFRSGREKLACS